MTANWTRFAAVMGLAVALFLIPAKVLAQAPPPLITNFPSWELASEFNDVTNPIGVWTYCSKTTLSSTTCPTMLNPFVSTWGSDVLGWTATGGFPVVVHNTHPYAITGPPAYPYMVTVPPHALAMHPGPNGQYAVVRFTAPFTGYYKISGQFYALDDNLSGTITDVHILKNNNAITQLFAGNVNYYGGARYSSFTSVSVGLIAGDTLDFQVGFGVNRNYVFGSTGLNAVIEKIK